MEKICAACGKVIEPGEEWINDAGVIRHPQFMPGFCVRRGMQMPVAQPIQPPMPLRAYIATAVLQGLVGNREWDRYEKRGEELRAMWAKQSVEIADALIEELSK